MTQQQWTPEHLARLAWREQIEHDSPEQHAWYALSRADRAGLLAEQEYEHMTRDTTNEPG